jgi:hypothetical protein
MRINKGKSKGEVQAPRRWKSGPNHPKTHLAYITDEEHALLKSLDLHGSGVRHEDHFGPKRIPSLNGGGDAPSDDDDETTTVTGNWDGAPGTTTTGGVGTGPGGDGTDASPTSAPGFGGVEGGLLGPSPDDTNAPTWEGGGSQLDGTSPATPGGWGFDGGGYAGDGTGEDYGDDTETAAERAAREYDESLRGGYSNPTQGLLGGPPAPNAWDSYRVKNLLESPMTNPGAARDYVGGIDGVKTAVGDALSAARDYMTGNLRRSQDLTQSNLGLRAPGGLGVTGTAPLSTRPGAPSPEDEDKTWAERALDEDPRKDDGYRTLPGAGMTVPVSPTPPASPVTGPVVAGGGLLGDDEYRDLPGANPNAPVAPAAPAIPTGPSRLAGRSLVDYSRGFAHPGLPTDGPLGDDPADANPDTPAEDEEDKTTPPQVQVATGPTYMGNPVQSGSYFSPDVAPSQQGDWDVREASFREGGDNYIGGNLDNQGPGGPGGGDGKDDDKPNKPGNGSKGKKGRYGLPAWYWRWFNTQQKRGGRRSRPSPRGLLDQ